MSVVIQAEANESQSECISPKVNKLDVASLSQLKSSIVPAWSAGISLVLEGSVLVFRGFP